MLQGHFGEDEEDPRVHARRMSRMARVQMGRAKASLEGPTAHQLTPRQCEILLLLAEGDRIEENAMILSLSPATVRTHLRNTYQLLGVSRWYEAVQVARRLHLIPSEKEEVAQIPF